MTPLTRTARRAVLGACLAAGALATPALAQDFPVTTAGQFVTALGTAQNNVTADRILLAAGTYTLPDNVVYSGGDLEIIGAGRDATILAGSGDFVLSVGGSGPLRVADLSVTLGGSAAGLRRGLVLGGPSATIENVAVDVTGTGANSTGINLQTSSTVRNVSVAGATNGGFDITAPATLTDVTVVGDPAGAGISAEAQGASPVVISRTRVTGANAGIAALFGAHVTVRDSVVTVPATRVGLDVGDNNNNTGFTSSLTAERVTVVAAGATGTGVRVGTGGSAPVSNDDMSLHLVDSIVQGFSRPYFCGMNLTNVATLTTDHTNIPLTGSQSTCTTVTHTARTELAPGFVDQAGGDYRLRWDSPLRDLGGTPPALPGTDLGGGARAVDGDGDGTATVDLGAFEYQRNAPTASALASATEVAAGQAVSFSATGTDADPLETKPLAYAWAFSDGGVATGAVVDHAFTAPGPQSATVTVTDPSGRSATATVTVTVSAPPTAPAAGGTSPAPLPAPPALTPTLGRLVVQRSYRHGAAGTVRVALGGVSGRVAVTGTVTRRAAARPVLRRMSATAAAGTVVLRFRAPSAPGRYRVTVRAAGLTRSALIVVR